MVFIAIIDALISFKPAMFALGIVVIIGALEGILEEYLKFVDKKILEEAVSKDEQSDPLQPSTF